MIKSYHIIVYTRTHINIFPFQENLYGKRFEEKLAELHEVYPEFTCRHGYTDSYGKRRLKRYNVVEDAMDAMRQYCLEHNINIVELFSRFDADGSMSVTHDEFKLGLKVGTSRGGGHSIASASMPSLRIYITDPV